MVADSEHDSPGCWHSRRHLRKARLSMENTSYKDTATNKSRPKKRRSSSICNLSRVSRKLERNLDTVSTKKKRKYEKENYICDLTNTSQSDSSQNASLYSEDFNKSKQKNRRKSKVFLSNDKYDNFFSGVDDSSAEVDLKRFKAKHQKAAKSKNEFLLSRTNCNTEPHKTFSSSDISSDSSVQQCVSKQPSSKHKVQESERKTYSLRSKFSNPEKNTVCITDGLPKKLRKNLKPKSTTRNTQKNKISMSYNKPENKSSAIDELSVTCNNNKMKINEKNSTSKKKNKSLEPGESAINIQSRSSNPKSKIQGNTNNLRKFSCPAENELNTPVIDKLSVTFPFKTLKSKEIKTTVKGIKATVPTKGTLKFKRWVLDGIKENNKHYEDDIFESDYREPVNGSLDFDNESEISFNMATPKFNSILTPVISNRVVKYKDVISPTELSNARKCAEEYMFRRNKKRKLKSRGECSLGDSRTSQDDSGAFPEKLRLDFDGAVSQISDIQKRIDKQNPMDDSDQDDYFSDLSE